MNDAYLGDDPRFGLGYAIAAYIVLIVAFFGYAAWIHLRCARLQARLDDVQRRLGAQGASSPRP
jgi:hypothetical protein